MADRSRIPKTWDDLVAYIRELAVEKGHSADDIKEDDVLYFLSWIRQEETSEFSSRAMADLFHTGIPPTTKDMTEGLMENFFCDFLGEDFEKLTLPRRRDLKVVFDLLDEKIMDHWMFLQNKG